VLDFLSVSLIPLVVFIAVGQLGSIIKKNVSNFIRKHYKFEKEKNMKFRIIIEQDEDGMFVAEVPSLPGCISQGATRKEALSNIKNAITGYL
jgi:hypothetical protein